MDEQYKPSSIENTEKETNQSEELENNALSLIKAVEEDNKLEADKDLTEDFFRWLPESTKKKINDAEKKESENKIDTEDTENSENESGNDSKNETNTEDAERTKNNIRQLCNFNLLSTLSSGEWSDISYQNWKLFVKQNHEMVELTTKNMVSLLNLVEKGKKQFETNPWPTKFNNIDEITELVNWNDEIKNVWLEQIKRWKENNVIVGKSFNNINNNNYYDRNYNSEERMNERDRMAYNVEKLCEFDITSVLEDEMKDIVLESPSDVSQDEYKLFIKDPESANGEMIELTIENMASLLNLEEKAEKQLRTNPWPTKFNNVDEIKKLVNWDEEYGGVKIRKAWIKKIIEKKMEENG